MLEKLNVEREQVYRLYYKLLGAKALSLQDANQICDILKKLLDYDEQSP